MLLLLLLALAAAATVPAAVRAAEPAPALLPYPRSARPLLPGSRAFVVSENPNNGNVPITKADLVTLQTLAGMLARHSPQIYTIKSASASCHSPGCPVRGWSPYLAVGETVILLAPPFHPYWKA